MHRRRSAVTVSTAAALLLAAPLLTGCGETHPGAAAVVDGDRISLAQLQSRVGEARAAQRKMPQGEQMIRRTGQLTRSTLDGMIRHRVVEQALKDAGVGVSRSELQRQRDVYEQQTGGAKGFRQALLEQQGIAPSAADDWVWLNVAVQKVAKAWDIDPASPQGNQELNKRFSELSGEMDIVVNPRYGTWDAKSSALTTEKMPWLNDVTGEKALEQQRA
ncbi:SurA N-terminal domain-containing protein [Streptomyces sp. DSM 42041]|uniref:SurA N-terminal domain-containing protein n=1 Tax=Streptomyces hazeniae TaxID=3075538 RepID=A0ABU2P221_9ACTN|nr:SurA N-terminal domain-containing protein [Streptomyces sp. DSM 42041]MDT0381963.1 SurA N-terminal domain-containing protein [Streptomyces sp. DSM 42041]